MMENWILKILKNYFPDLYVWLWTVLWGDLECFPDKPTTSNNAVVYFPFINVIQGWYLRKLLWKCIHVNYRCWSSQYQTLNLLLEGIVHVHLLLVSDFSLDLTLVPEMIVLFTSSIHLQCFMHVGIWYQHQVN